MAAPKVPSLTEALIGALDDLSDYDFQRFKLYLEESAVLGQFERIPRSKLETEEKTKILKAMKDCYGIFTITVMKTVLEELNCHLILEELSKCPFDPNVVIIACRKELQSLLKSKFQFLNESLFESKEKMPFNEGYTKLFITEADSGQVNEEHEVRQMQKHSRTSAKERTVQCQDIFKGTTDTGEPVRTVLTKGVAGVGKTVLTQKFSLDWAEGTSHQDVQLLFHFTFRDLNVLRDTKYSLVELIHCCFSQSKALFSFQYIDVLFILDGLDECRPPLNFRRARVLTEPTESASVEELLVNLIRGNLVPSARLWITTRPAAANQIPNKCISMVTEVRGFTDPQKEQFFRKRFTDEQQATAVISHIKSIRSLFIMCHLPIVCRILFTVLLHLMKTNNRGELPTTLTQMYVHFLVVQAKVKNVKYEGREETDDYWTPETIEMVRSLGKLAFEQLQNGKLIFYQSDLSQCGLDAAEIARYSGVFTEVFREEPGQGFGKVYCFIHLSVQEFLAALHVHETFFNSGVNLLSPQSSQSPNISKESSENIKSKKTNQQQNAANTPEQKSFIRQLMSCFQPTLPTLDSSDSEFDESYSDQDESTAHCSEDPDPKKNLLSPPHSSDSINPKAFYRSAVDRALQSPNGHLDLFLRFLLGLSLPTNQTLLEGLLNQMGSEQTNQETVKYIQKKLTVKDLSSERSLNLLHCLSELNDRSLLEDIQKYMREGYLTWLYSPAQWSAVSFLLLSSDTELEDFDLRKYCPSEKGLQGLLPVVKASTKATLSWCGLTSRSCGPASPLASVVSSSSLTHLDLSNNDLQDSGVELLCSSVRRLETLNLSGCGLTSRSCAPLASVLSSSGLTLLDLSNNDIQDSGVKLLCEGLKSAPCRLDTLRLSGCLISEKGGAYLAATLSSTSSNISELDLSYNHPGPCAELLTALQAPQGPLQKLRLDPTVACWRVPGLRKYACDVSLDSNSAHRCLRLSKNNHSVTRERKEQLYPDHEDRFTHWPQVLGSTGLTRRCYWEVDWSGLEGGVDIAVSYRRDDEESVTGGFGYNDWSWSLQNDNERYVACHKGHKVDNLGVSLQDWGGENLVTGSQLYRARTKKSSGRVGVFLDWEAGVLSFYKVQPGGGLLHIHTFITPFTEPVFPGFRLYYKGSSVSLVNLNSR